MESRDQGGKCAPLHYVVYIEGVEGQTFRPMLFLRDFLGEGSRLIIGQGYSAQDLTSMRIGGLSLLSELLPYQSCYLVNEMTLLGILKTEIFGDAVRFPGVEAYVNNPETSVTTYGDILNTGEELFLLSIGTPPRLKLLVSGDWQTLYAYEWKASSSGVAEVYSVQPFEVRDSNDAIIVYNSAVDGLCRVPGADYQGSQGLVISRIGPLDSKNVPPTASLSSAIRSEIQRKRPDLDTSAVKFMLHNSGLVQVLLLLKPEAEARALPVEVEKVGQNGTGRDGGDGEVGLKDNGVTNGNPLIQIDRVPYETIIQTRYGADGVARKIKFYIPVDLDFDPAEFEQQLEGISQLPVGHKGIIRFNG